MEQHEIYSDKRVLRILKQIFFDFLRDRNLISVYLVNLFSSYFSDVKKQKHNLYKVLKNNYPGEWINLFSWSHTTHGHELWEQVHIQWQNHPIISILRDIFRAYRFNPNQVKLPEGNAIDATLCLLRLWTDYENQSKYFVLTHDETTKGIPYLSSINKYIKWKKTPQGELYWARIHNAICATGHESHVQAIAEEDNIDLLARSIKDKAEALRTPESTPRRGVIVVIGAGPMNSLLARSIIEHLQEIRK